MRRVAYLELADRPGADFVERLLQDQRAVDLADGVATGRRRVDAAGAGEGSITNDVLTSDWGCWHAFRARAASEPPSVGRQNAPERENGAWPQGASNLRAGGSHSPATKLGLATISRSGPTELPRASRELGRPRNHPRSDTETLLGARTAPGRAGGRSLSRRSPSPSTKLGLRVL